MGIKNVAAVVSGMDEEYPFQIILGINEFARKHDINISYFAAFGGIIESEEFDIGEFSIYTLPDFSHFDGALLLSNTFSNPKIRNAIIDKVKASGIPAVIFECADYPEFHDVSIDNYAVMKRLVEHLITEHGARTFNYISGPLGNPEARDRYRAFKDALSEHSIEFDEESRMFEGVFRSYDGIRAIEAFEASGMSLPDAFVSANDSMALTAMTKLQHMGYKIPDDVMITGFDNTFNAQTSCPVLTTVKRPLLYSGDKACEILLALMNGEKRPRSTILEAEPVFAESCGCPDNGIGDVREYQQKTAARFERTYANVHMLNRLIAGLADSETLEECIDSIEKMLGTINCSEFALCIVKNWETTYSTASIGDDTKPYAEIMTSPLILKDGVRCSVDTFPSSQLYPIVPETGGNISYFMPLHFNQRCLGYYIISNNDFPINSLLCHTMTMCIGNAIDNISKINVLDPLCKIYNRNGFNRNAGGVFKECVITGHEVSVGFLDMDDLKYINDTYGHKEGDFALKSIADAISSSCSSLDICARYGGDEFVVLGVGEGFIDSFNDKLKKKLNEINEKSGKPYKIDGSVGYVTMIPDKKQSLLEMIQEADSRMYKQKQEKKQSWVIVDE